MTKHDRDFLNFLNSLFGEPHGNGTHKHRCRCGHLWQHEDGCVNDTKAHTCKCGREVWVKYHGSENAELKLCRAA